MSYTAATRPPRRLARATLAGRIAVGLGLMIALSGCIIEPYHPYYRPHPYYYY